MKEYKPLTRRNPSFTIDQVAKVGGFHFNDVELIGTPVTWQGSHETTAVAVADRLSESNVVIAWAKGAEVVWQERNELQRAWFHIAASLRLKRV